VHGPINTMRDLAKIIKAIAAENFDSGADDKGNVLEIIAEAFAHGYVPSFEMQECNYASIDDVESVLQDCGCSWSVDHASGGDYPAGYRSWSVGRGDRKVDANDGMATVDIMDLRKLMEGDDPLTGIRKIIADADMALAHDLPKRLVAGEKVARYLAGLVADEALGLKKAS